MTARKAVARSDEAPAYDNAGFTFRSLAVPSRGSTELAVWTLEVAPGARSERHTVDKEEVFVLQQGVVFMEIGDALHELSPGDAAIVAPGTPLCLHNQADVPAHLTVCTSKGVRGTVNGTTIILPWAQ